MQKFVVVISSIFEFVFYTFFMVLIGSIPFTNKLLELFVYFVSLLVVALAFYFLLRFLFSKLGLV